MIKEGLDGGLYLSNLKFFSRYYYENNFISHKSSPENHLNYLKFIIFFI